MRMSRYDIAEKEVSCMEISNQYSPRKLRASGISTARDMMDCSARVFKFIRWLLTSKIPVPLVASLMLSSLPITSFAVGVDRPEGFVMPSGIFAGCRQPTQGDLYPPRLKSEKITGRVLVEFEIGKSGRVKNIVVIESDPQGSFDSPVMRWLKTFQCKSRKSSEVSTRFRYGVVFSLRDRKGKLFDKGIEFMEVTVQ
jgi:TonB family protein